MLRNLLIVAILFTACSSNAQFMVQGEFDPLWPLQLQYKESGWFFAPGMTRTFTNGPHTELMETEDGDKFEYDATPTGKYGVFLEVGRYKLLKDDVFFFEHLDYSLAFKQVKGRESIEGIYPNNPNSGKTYSGAGTFNSYYASANFNLNHWTQVTDKGFIRASIGLNADYRVIDATNFEGTEGPRERSMPPQFIGQAHFKLGYGWKISQKWFVIPTLETPILNAYPWDEGLSTIEAFSSRYRPVTLSLRFLIRNKLPPDECPPVPGGTDSEMNKEKLDKGNGGGGKK